MPEQAIHPPLPDTARATEAAEASSSIDRSCHVQSIDVRTTPSSGNYKAHVTLRGSVIEQLLPVTLFTSDTRLQGLLETALATGNLIEFHGIRRPGTSFDPGTSILPVAALGLLEAYDVDRIQLFNHP